MELVANNRKRRSWRLASVDLNSNLSNANCKLGESFSYLDDSVFLSPELGEIVTTGRGLCRDYLCYRLKRSGYLGRIVITQHAPAFDQRLSHKLLVIGVDMERRFPHLFNNLARQLGFTIISQEVLQDLFFKLAENIMGQDSDKYTWSRILCLFGIAGALAVDCISQGHGELVEQLVIVFSDFISLKLVTWVQKHGGWISMVDHFKLEDEGTHITHDVVVKTIALSVVIFVFFIVICISSFL